MEWRTPGIMPGLSASIAKALNRRVEPTSDTLGWSHMPLVPPNPPDRVEGQALWKGLGFNNERAFQRARSAGRLKGLRLYPIGGRSRGVYARSDEFSTYLAQRAQAAGEGS